MQHNHKFQELEFGHFGRSITVPTKLSKGKNSFIDLFIYSFFSTNIYLVPTIYQKIYEALDVLSYFTCELWEVIKHLCIEQIYLRNFLLCHILSTRRRGLGGNWQHRRLSDNHNCGVWSSISNSYADSVHFSQIRGWVWNEEWMMWMYYCGSYL